METERNLRAVVNRYRPFALLLAAVVLVTVVPPGPRSSSSSEPVATVDASSKVEPAAASPTDAEPVPTTATTLTAVTAKGTQATGTGTRSAPAPSPRAAAAGSAMTVSSTVTGQAARAPSSFIGSAAALAAPDCDTQRGRIKVPTAWAPHCAVPWPAERDNGGATARGVTAQKVRVVVTHTSSAQDDTQPAWVDNAAAYERFYRLWGRSVEVVFFQKSGTDETSQRADAIKIADLKPFAAWTHPGGSATLILNQELASRGIVVLTANSPVKYTLVKPGYIWGATLPPNDPNLPQTAEYVGKRLVGKPARWAGDPTFQAQLRKFGLIYPDDWNLDQFKSEFAKYGGSIVDAVSYTNNYDVATYQERARVIAARLKSQGVSSVITGSDGVLNIVLSKEATAQAWFPEWVIAAVGGSDVDLLARLNDQQQWQHAFGLSMLPTPVQGTALPDMFEWYWGSEAPRKTRGSGTGGISWAVFTLYTGLHMAGPNLTPEAFAAGMFAYPPSGGISCNCVTSHQISWGRHGVTPYDDFNAWDDFAEVWWDATFVGRGNDRIADGAPGHYRYMEGGKRRLPGQWPAGEPPAFEPSKAAHYDQAPPHERAPAYECKGCPGR